MGVSETSTQKANHGEPNGHALHVQNKEAFADPGEGADTMKILRALSRHNTDGTLKGGEVSAPKEIRRARANVPVPGFPRSKPKVPYSVYEAQFDVDGL